MHPCTSAHQPDCSISLLHICVYLEPSVQAVLYLGCDGSWGAIIFLPASVSSGFPQLSNHLCAASVPQIFGFGCNRVVCKRVIIFHLHFRRQIPTRGKQLSHRFLTFPPPAQKFPPVTSRIRCFYWQTVLKSSNAMLRFETETVLLRGRLS